MNYILKYFDTDLIKFSAQDGARPNYKILWLNKEKIELMPLGLRLTEEGIENFIKRRNIPKNRAYVHGFLAKCGLNINRPLEIIKISKGLSLNDCYWIEEEGEGLKFKDINLYDNKFSNILASIVFTGYGSSVRSSLRSSPEFTTNGMLPKCWRRIEGKIYLYKGGTFGASNTGNEPYSEFYAYQIAEAMGINAISYHLTRWNETLCSTCELFTSKKFSFVPVGNIVTSGGIEAVEKYYQKLGEDFYKAYGDMILLDAIICNTDRHFGNFGFLVDNKTNTIVKPAPLFDHGNSLFNFVTEDVYSNQEKFDEYVSTLVPCNYDDYFSYAKEFLDNRRRKMLRKLLEFKLKKHARYNLNNDRLKAIEGMIRRRASMLLEVL